VPLVPDTFSDPSNFYYNDPYSFIFEASLFGAEEDWTEALRIAYQENGLAGALYFPSSEDDFWQTMGKRASWGKTPLSGFVFYGHTVGNGINNHKRENQATMKIYPKGPKHDNGGVSFANMPEAEATKENAFKKQGPPRCWFTRNAIGRVVGCASRHWASEFAHKILRPGSTIYGTTDTLLLHYVMGFKGYSWSIKGYDKHPNLFTLLKSTKGWEKFEGGKITF